MIAGLCRPPPHTSHSRGGAGKCGSRGRHRRGGHLGQASRRRRRPTGRPARRRGNRRGRAISAAGARSRGAAESRATCAAEACPARAKRAVEIGRPGRYGAAPNRRSGHCPVRCRRRGSRPSSVADPGHVADAAEVEDRQRLRQIGGQGGMVERHQRRALAAGGDIGAAEIGDDIDPDEPRQQGAVADLPGAALVRAVQDRMAVKADQVERGRRMLLRGTARRLRHAAGSARPRPRRPARRRPARRAAARGSRRDRAGSATVRRRPAARRRSPARRHRCRRARCRSSGPARDAARFVLDERRHVVV